MAPVFENARGHVNILPPSVAVTSWKRRSSAIPERRVAIGRRGEGGERALSPAVWVSRRESGNASTACPKREDAKEATKTPKDAIPKHVRRGRNGNHGQCALPLVVADFSAAHAIVGMGKRELTAPERRPKSVPAKRTSVPDGRIGRLGRNVRKRAGAG